MATKATREQIVTAADQLFYQQGFEHTSFAHIAEAVKISRGNFYYHFKSKDEILTAVINHRLQNTETMLETWTLEGDSPVERVKSFINIMRMNQNKIKQFGCPVGSLTTELAKLDHRAQGEANQLFLLFRIWLSEQFTALGFNNADDLAMHLLGRSQGIATLASAFNDSAFIEQEVRLLHQWLEQLLADKSE